MGYTHSKLKMTSEVHKYSPCNCCKQTYSELWYHKFKGDTTDKNSCYFCSKFLPIRNTKTDILNNIENAFLWSGYTSRYEYYNLYINHCNKWCEHWSIKTTDDELKQENELRKVKDWTREYWH